MLSHVKLLFRPDGPTAVSRLRSNLAGELCELAGSCRGGLLLETVLAVTVFTLVGTATLSGLSTAHFSGAKTESRSIGESIGRSQMERLFALPYQPPPSAYPTIAVPPGYSVSAVAREYAMGNPDVATLVVTVRHQGKEVLALETLRARE